MEELKEYNSQRICPKCGFDRIDDSYQSDLVLLKDKFVTEERIDRTCLRCKYVWSEKPLSEDKVR